MPFTVRVACNTIAERAPSSEKPWAMKLYCPPTPLPMRPSSRPSEITSPSAVAIIASLRKRASASSVRFRSGRWRKTRYLPGSPGAADQHHRRRRRGDHAPNRIRALGVVSLGPVYGWHPLSPSTDTIAAGAAATTPSSSASAPNARAPASACAIPKHFRARISMRRRWKFSDGS